MTEIMAIDCQSVKQHIASGLRYDCRCMNAREILAKNLIRLMGGHPKYRDREAVQKACGVSARTVGYMREGTGNPTIANIEAVARLFKLEAWELLMDPTEARKRLMTRLFDEPVAQDQVVEKSVTKTAKISN